MAHGSSSISNSRRRFARYGLTIAILFLGQMAVVGGMLARQYWIVRDTDNSLLLTYQLQKIDRSQGIDTVFVGDSSLGNAIDTATFDHLTGSHSLNLALTGTDGYAASYNMIRRSAARFPGLRNVVVLQTTDVTMRGIAYHGWLYTTPDWDTSIFSLQQKLNLANSFVRIHNNFDFFYALALDGLDRLSPGRFWPADREIISNYARIRVDPRIDYIPQLAHSAPAATKVTAYKGSRVRADSAFFLERIHELCQAQRLTCVTAFGPMAVEEQALSRDMIAAAARLVGGSGLRLVGDTPMPMTLDEMGDTHHHNRADLKAAFTARYARLLAPHLELPQRPEAEQ